MEPPSRQLLDLLSRYGLATPADLRRCRPQVRRLAHDLPTFDSVWIDALTQKRVITPFQAKLLESEQPQRLQVGPCLLVEEWERDGRWTLRLARHRGSRQKCLLTFVDVHAHDRPKALQQCRDLIARLRGLSHPSVVVPQGCDEADGWVVVVSPFVSGPTLKQLLVRRGRFPIPVVTDIAWQLIDGLAALEQREVVHGDLALTSVRLTERGQAVLMHPGVLPALGSRVSIHAPLGPENYEGTAPELINSARTATLQSDLYAVGCLLWQLLAGRPPYPAGDPLAKLAAHQTKPIDDIRRWVPDAPAELSALIRQLTDKNPARRGSGPREIRDTRP
ncbi:MAG: serine/threonine protein kinase [Planctomycetaceae bacterium]